MLEFLIVLAVLAAVVAVLGAPLLRSSRSPAPAPTDRPELEAAREAKYREIREAELDHRTGKLSDHDYELLDRQLRAEAIEILHALDSPRGSDGDE
jgi:hypothetical protein